MFFKNAIKNIYLMIIALIFLNIAEISLNF